jgi:hypothetical protein
VKRAALIGLACLGAAAATGTAGAEPQAPTGTAAIAYKLTIDGEQVTTWTASGALVWCDTSTQQVPVDGSGTETLTFRLAKPAGVSLRAGQPFEFGGQLTMKAERAGTLTKRWSTVTDRPAPRCARLVTPVVDEAARTAGCGVFGYRMPVEIRSAAGAPAVVSDDPSVTRWSGLQECPWLATDIDEGAALASPPEDVPELAGGLLVTALAPALRAPARLDGKPLVATATATKAYSATAGGVTLTATTTVRLSVRLESVLKVTVAIKPGRSIAGVAPGMSAPKALRVSGTKVGPANWQGGNYGGVQGPDITYWQAVGPELTVQIAARGRHRGKPPASAVVVWIRTSGLTRVTPDGIGYGSTPAEVKRAYPKGTFLDYGSGFGFWVVDGPGRRRTAFEFSGLLKGKPVRVIVLGCRPPPGQPLETTGVVALGRDRIVRC